MFPGKLNAIKHAFGCVRACYSIQMKFTRAISSIYDHDKTYEQKFR